MYLTFVYTELCNKTTDKSLVEGMERKINEKFEKNAVFINSKNNINDDESKYRQEEYMTWSLRKKK